MPRGFYTYNRENLHARLKALGPKIRAQGGLPDAGEYPSLTQILLTLVETAERMLEEEQRWEVVRIPPSAPNPQAMP